MSAMTMAQRYAAARECVQKYGQEHLLAFYDGLNPAQQTQLLDDLAQVDFARCADLAGRFVRRRPEIGLPSELLPAEVFPAEDDPAAPTGYEASREAGRAALADGRVAAFTVAGGQGTRLGYDGPKGGFAITPIRQACLFQVFAEFLQGAGRRYGRIPPWYIMTSPLNHEATLAIFEAHDYFGLARDGVMFFAQGQMPAFHPDGRIALAARHRVALGPDGHGGSLRALAERGALADMKQRGVDFVSYFQVDNPLVRPVDPLFIGLHIEHDSEMSSKAVTKAHDLERVGNFCLADGRVQVIEYSDIPEELVRQKNADGSRRFDAGSIAIHMISRGFIERLTGDGSGVELPWHRADKKVAVLNEAGELVQPEAPNVVKLELFVFDAIPLARNPLVLYTNRAEEFSPVKNAEGDDSPATTRRDLLRRAARWLEHAGVSVPRTAEGEPDVTLEITPRRALDATDLADQLGPAPTLAPGGRLLLD